MTGQGVGEILQALKASGVTVTLNTTRDGLCLTGKGQPPAKILEQIRARKADFVAHLRDHATPARPDWAAIAAQPGRCGSCARATDAPEWGSLMVTCACPTGAFEAGTKPLALHIGHRCIAYMQPGEQIGNGWRQQHQAHPERGAA